MSIAFFIPDSQIIRTFAKVIKNGDARPCPPFYKRAGRRIVATKAPGPLRDGFCSLAGGSPLSVCPCRRGR